MGNALFATKPLDVLMKEAGDTGEHSLKRALGPINLVTLGIGAINFAWPQERQTRQPRIDRAGHGHDAQL